MTIIHAVQAGFEPGTFCMRGENHTSEPHTPIRGTRFEFKMSRLVQFFLSIPVNKNRYFYIKEVGIRSLEHFANSYSLVRNYRF